MSISLFTIGYEGAVIKDFIKILKSFEIKVLVDIREVPVSRKRGFSKNALAQALEQVKIGYVPLRDLGNPKPGREAARRGDMSAFKQIFREHIRTDKALKALEQARDIAYGDRACLLCFERDYSSCHRNIVAEEMLGHKINEINHVDVESGEVYVTARN